MATSGESSWKMMRIGRVVEDSLDKLGVRGRVQEHRAMAEWKEAVGNHIASASFPENVRDGVMFVCCKSSAWANELSLHKRDIISRLNRSIGSQVIKDIRFSSHGYRKSSGGQDQEGGTYVRALQQVPLSKDQVDFANRTASAIEEPRLADKVRRAMLAGARLDEVKLKDGWKRCKICSAPHSDAGDVCPACKGQ
jgi:hypothetical protein